MAPPDFRKTQEWKAILEKLNLIFHKSTRLFDATYKRNLAAFAELSKEIPYISAHRMDELFRSCADDLYRYATYHDVKVVCGKFSIAQFVEAAHLTKWVATFHPIIINSIDGISPDDFLATVRILEEKDNEKKPKTREQIVELFRKSNEIFNMFVASQA